MKGRSITREVMEEANRRYQALADKFERVEYKCQAMMLGEYIVF